MQLGFRNNGNVVNKGYNVHKWFVLAYILTSLIILLYVEVIDIDLFIIDKLYNKYIIELKQAIKKSSLLILFCIYDLGDILEIL